MVSKTTISARVSEVRILPSPRKIMLNPFKKTKKEPDNWKELLSRFLELEKDQKEISEELEKVKKNNKSNFQKIGIVRFNPFKEVGSDQSFSVAILDGNDNGVVITSLYTRDKNRVYGKEIKAGISEYNLSEEEKQAIEKAKHILDDNFHLNSKYGKNKPKINNSTTSSGSSRPC